jgi:peptidoglycan hydrolase-like protein with peptidoglycan-binding domain
MRALPPRTPTFGVDARWVAITGFKNDRARVVGLVPDQVVTIMIEELESHWLETGIIVWERYEPFPTLISPNEKGPGVLWLQRALAELHFFEGAPSGHFDDTTSEAVRRFQVDRGLVSDGVAGPLTQIALYAGLDRYPVPRLSQFTTATTAASASTLNSVPTVTPPLTPPPNRISSSLPSSSPTTTQAAPTTTRNIDGVASPARSGDRG